MIRITVIDGYGADGMAFVVQNHSPSALGPEGSGLGYGHAGEPNTPEGIPNSLAVEFDTFQYYSGDPADNHIAVHTRGVLPNTVLLDSRIGVTTATPELSDGEVHTVRIDYSPGFLDMYLDEMKYPALTVLVDLAATLDLDGGQAWVGFNAGTGAH